MMTLAPFLKSDVPSFLALAKEEGWICGKWEFAFLLRGFPQGCLVLRHETAALGYVTSIRHENSGWIGNLLVRPEARRQGVGRALMEGALHALSESGVRTVWLTASAKGAALYHRLGFVSIDIVNRWTGEGGGRSQIVGPRPSREDVLKVDLAGWGDRREALVDTTCARGDLYGNHHSFICCQPWAHGTQIGPWGARVDSQAEAFLDTALATVKGRVFLDVPAGNLAAASLLTKRGFAIKGSNTLMYLGVAPEYDAKLVFALASMGSMG